MPPNPAGHPVAGTKGPDPCKRPRKLWRGAVDVVGHPAAQLGGRERTEAVPPLPQRRAREAVGPTVANLAYQHENVAQPAVRFRTVASVRLDQQDHLLSPNPPLSKRRTAACRSRRRAVDEVEDGWGKAAFKDRHNGRLAALRIAANHRAGGGCPGRGAQPEDNLGDDSQGPLAADQQAKQVVPSPLPSPPFPQLEQL